MRETLLTINTNLIPGYSGGGTSTKGVMVSELAAYY